MADEALRSLSPEARMTALSPIVESTVRNFLPGANDLSLTPYLERAAIYTAEGIKRDSLTAMVVDEQHIFRVTFSVSIAADETALVISSIGLGQKTLAADISRDISEFYQAMAAHNGVDPALLGFNITG